MKGLQEAGRKPTPKPETEGDITSCNCSSPAQTVRLTRGSEGPPSLPPQLRLPTALCISPNSCICLPPQLPLPTAVCHSPNSCIYLLPQLPLPTAASLPTPAFPPVAASAPQLHLPNSSVSPQLCLSPPTTASPPQLCLSLQNGFLRNREADVKRIRGTNVSVLCVCVSM